MQELMDKPDNQSQFYPPSAESLRAQALKFVKENQPEEYRHMKKDGELEAYLDLKVKACQEYAASLIASGLFVNQAWISAIRQEILESNTD